MRARGLRAQILILLIVPLMLSAPAALWTVQWTLQTEFLAETDRRGIVLAQQAGDLVVDDLVTGELLAATSKLTELQRTDAAIAYIFTVDARGRVSSHTFAEGFPVDLLAVHDLRPDGQPREVRMGPETVRDVSNGMLGGAAGTVHVGLSDLHARETVRVIFVRLALVGGFVVALGVGLAFWMSRRFTARIERIARAANAVADGDLDVRVPVRGGDEIAQLSSRFNEMVERVANAQHEREATFAKLTQSEKLMAIGRLAAGVAHELNNPLSGLRHCIDNLRRTSSVERQEKYYGLMEDGVDRVQRIVGGLLNYARTRPPERSRQSVRMLIDRSVELVRSAGAKEADIIVDVPKDLPDIEVDSHQIQQVLINLITNGLESMGAGGSVRVIATLEGARCRIDVRDEGKGIPPGELGKVFEPFFTTKGKTGSGLGLSVSRGIVDRHGGQIEIVSQRSGTTVTLFLPVNAPDDEKP